FLPALLALIVTMFSLEDRPQGLPQALAADVLFQGKVALNSVSQMVAQTPDRRAGTVGDRAVANEVAHSFAASGFRTVIDPFSGGGKDLVNVVARRSGGSRRQIVVLAERDAASVPDATGSASDTATLLEIANVLQGTPSRKTVVLASVDGGTLGGLGVKRVLDTLPDRNKIEAVIVLSNMGAPGPRIPPLVGWSNGSQRVGVGLGRTAANSISQEFGRAPGGSSAASQMIRLAFPLGIGPQGQLLDGGVDAIRFSGSGELPERSRTRVSDIDVDRLGSLGRSVLRTLFAIDQSSRPLERGPTAYVTVARKVLPGWALALLGFTLILPALVASIDAFARASRKQEPVGRWLRWVLVAALPLLAVLALTKVSVWAGIVADPPPAPLPPDMRPLHAGDAITLGVLAAVAVLVWLVGGRWTRGVGRRRSVLDPADPGAGTAVALVLSVATALVWLINPFAALMLVPALHLWLIAATANVPRRGAAPILLVAAGLLPIAIVVIYYLDALSIGPLHGLWYLFLLVASGDIGVLTCVFASLLVAAFGSLVAVLVARARRPPAAATADIDHESVFGPGGYAGPGALGGTRSALRR
ncbi:MAG: M28 family peptidase, partial [Thermoleophilaceae bacterium]